ncbi:MAG: CPBP family intramembrane metalloprotease [Ruminococcus sp.]|jgi:membrane protease YdiL (CAAX protease family)|nr:CPBP family intramembrane metalloprotease [Ruminococcus sp.]
MNEQGIKKRTALNVIIHCILFLAAQFLVNVIAALVHDFLGNALKIDELINIIIFSVIEVGLGYTFAFLYIKFIFKASPSEFRIKKPAAKKWFLLAFLLPALIWAFYLIFVPGEIVIDTLPPEKTWDILIRTFITVSLRAALVEELYFRAGVLHFFELRFGKIVAVIVSAVGFGLIHISNFTAEGLPAVIEAIPYFIWCIIMGLLLALLAIASDSIFIPAITHFCWNFFLGGGSFDINVNPDGIVNYRVLSDSWLFEDSKSTIAPIQICFMAVTAVVVFIVMKKKSTTPPQDSRTISQGP